jgi:hypothetical protein
VRFPSGTELVHLTFLAATAVRPGMRSRVMVMLTTPFDTIGRGIEAPLRPFRNGAGSIYR